MTTSLDPLTMPLRGSRLIEASAGTGKTWTIAALYLRLVLGHGDEDTRFAEPLAPSRILVMTFTRAATRELVERIRVRLVSAAKRFRGDDVRGADPFVDALIAAHEGDAARATAAHRLAAAAEAMDDAAVFTIDAWIGKMLREHAFDSGSLFDEELQPDDQAMLAEAVRDYWRQEIYPLRADALDDARRAWSSVDALLSDVRAMHAHVTIEDDGVSLAATRLAAVARRTMALRTIKQGWPERVEEMRKWLTSQLSGSNGPFDKTRLRPKTVDGWLDRLSLWASDAAEPGTGLTPAAVHRLSQAGFVEYLKPGRTIDVPPVFAAIAGLSAAMATIEDPVDAMRLHAAARVASRLRDLKQRAGVHGFQDLLERLDAALRGPGGDRLRTRIVEQFPVAMVDEFQDTSPLQYRVFDRLYRIADDARGTALLLIGDPKQSIYAFRGADIQSYLHARRATTGRHALLTINRRSQPALVDAINRLFGEAESRGEGAFRFGSSHDEPESPLPFVPVTAARLARTLHDARGVATAFTICHDAALGTRDDAIRRFAERAAEHVATSLNDRRAGFVDGDGRFERLAPSDIAVLVRDRKEAAAIRASLQRRGIASAYLSDQESVFASDEAVDLLHWLRAVAEPLDARLARLAFATRLIGLGLDEMASLRGDQADDDAAFEARIDQLRSLHETWRSQGVLPMVRRTLHLLELPARWLSQPDGERRLTNVLHLADLLQRASSGLDGGESLIRWFAEHVESGGRQDDEQVVRLESDADLVKVVTIHKAKGLEYPVVYLPFVCGVREHRWQKDGIAFPADADGTRHAVFHADADVRASIEREERQEDLRLLYVALTRAQHALWVGIAPIRVGNDPSCAFHRSAFGYLLTAGEEVDEHGIEMRLTRTFGDLPSVALEAITDDASRRTRLARRGPLPRLVDVPIYKASFERDWSIGSFSGLVRDLSRAKPLAVAAAMVDPAVEEEVLSGPVEEPETLVVADAARHRFPRGALAGNFLHDQLEWLATERFASSEVESQLVQRCERQGWGHRSTDVVTWLREIVTTPLAPIGTSLNRLSRILPEMEFWFPSERVDASAVDRLCRDALLDGRERPALPERSLNGMLMGFADLVFEVDGRYWVLDYKSNALGDHDADYTAEAIARSMAEHRYDVQGAIYLLALHRLLARRLGDRYDPAPQLGGALYLYLRGIHGPVGGCHVLAPGVEWLTTFDDLFARSATHV